MKKLFVAILKVTDENSRIRRHGGAAPRIRIRTKMSRIRNTDKMAYYSPSHTVPYLQLRFVYQYFTYKAHRYF
jgi:hypothetical protein